MAFAVVAVLGLFSWPRLPAGIRAYANSPLHLRRHPLALNEYYRRMANQAFAQGTAIVAADGLGGGNAIQTCENFFIDLASYTNGRPPDHTRVQVGDGEYLVLTSDGKGTITTELLAVIRGPFRVAAMPASSIHLLTSDSVDGKKGPADEDENQ